MESDAPHFRKLQQRLDDVRRNPKIGEPLRLDLSDCYGIDLGDFRLYYFFEETQMEVRFIALKRVLQGW